MHPLNNLVHKPRVVRRSGKVIDKTGQQIRFGQVEQRV